VLVLAMIAKTFAVVRQENDQRPFVQTALLQECDESTDRRVRRRDFSVCGS